MAAHSSMASFSAAGAAGLPAVAIRIAEEQERSPGKLWISPTSTPRSTSSARACWRQRRPSGGPLTEPGCASVIPWPNAIEHADPGGVSWMNRILLADRVVVVGIELAGSNIERLRAVDVGDGNLRRARASSPRWDLLFSVPRAVVLFQPGTLRPIEVRSVRGAAPAGVAYPRPSRNSRSASRAPTTGSP